MKDVRVTGLVKSFGKATAVDHVDFEVAAGSLVTLLGPSGCGKTTTLRLIAGLERPDAGEVSVGGRLLTSASQRIFLSPEKRRMGMVFQTYAIWPHMTVFENIAFPLRAKRLPAAVIRDRVMTILTTIGLEGFQDRPAPLLSGGQQQRVALGRALVADPDVLLLDEPFSNLDARLREDMRFELKELQARVGVTTLFVTHDQAEAMILSDRVLVMNAGRVAQDGTPRQIYEQPSSRFVMDFLGQVDHVSARVGRGPGGQYLARLDGVDGPPISLPADQPWEEGMEAVLAFRSADVKLLKDGAGGAWRGIVVAAVYLGDCVEYVIEVGASRLRTSGPVAESLEKGTVVELQVPSSAIRAWPARGAQAREANGSC
ncbi:MAG TPA: ABC transporter ATP-binding protein [Candidatus Methylomirabilis sp.]|nr:ABC transporter ATP-binding protein [Candidatus Methylomirabilis sp.]